MVGREDDNSDFRRDMFAVRVWMIFEREVRPRADTGRVLAWIDQVRGLGLMAC
jgi:hypothetical protein